MARCRGGPAAAAADASSRAERHRVIPRSERPQWSAGAERPPEVDLRRPRADAGLEQVRGLLHNAPTHEAIGVSASRLVCAEVAPRLSVSSEDLSVCGVNTKQ